MGRWGWRSANGVTTVETASTPIELGCRGCSWSPRAPVTMAAARAQAHRHVAKTGHVAFVDQMVTRVYGPDLT